MSFNSSNLGNFLWRWILKDCIDVQEKKKKVVALCRFTSFTKQELRDFHSVVVQQRQRKVQKSVMTCKLVVLLNKPIGFFDVLVAVARRRC